MTTHGLERHHPGNLRDKKISEEFRYPTSPPSDRPGRFMQYTRSIRVMKEDWISPDHSRGIVSYLTILINEGEMLGNPDVSCNQFASRGRAVQGRVTIITVDPINNVRQCRSVSLVGILVLSFDFSDNTPRDANHGPSRPMIVWQRRGSRKVKRPPNTQRRLTTGGLMRITNNEPRMNRVNVHRMHFCWCCTRLHSV